MNSALRIAEKEACKSTSNFKHGAVIFKGNRVLSRGRNTRTRHPSWGCGPMSSLHAETFAIRDAINRGVPIKGASILVCRLNGIMSSKPCKDCMKFIIDNEIKNILYTTPMGLKRMKAC